MKNAILAEMRKFFSTRMWWILLATMVAYMGFLAVVMAFTLTTEVPGNDVVLPTDPLATARSVYTIATALGYVFPAIVGTLAMTGEFRHRTITPTLLADPSRTRLLASKMVAAIPIGVLFGAVGTVACVLGGAGTLAMTGADPMLGSPEVWRSIGLSVLALTIWTLVGVGLGSAIPNQVGALVTLLAFTQFVEPIARTALGIGWPGPGGAIASFLPGAAGEALSEASIYATLGLADLLTWWQGGLILMGYAVVLGAIGRLTTLRRDVG